MEDMSQLQMEAILSPDSLDPFLTFISDLGNDEKKEEAESMLEIIKERDPESFALKLAHYVADPIFRQDNVTREACAEQLRKLLTGCCNEEDDDDEQTLFTWNNRLSVSTQSAIKCILLDSMKLEESEYIMDQLRFTVHKLATISDNNDEDWPQLFPFLFQSLTLSTSSVLLKSAVFRIFGGLAFRKGKTMVHCAKTLHPLFLTTLNDYTLDLDLRIMATAAAVFFIQLVPVSSNEKNKFQELLPGMMRTLTDTLSNCDKAEIVLEFFTVLAKEDPKFFGWQLRDVVFSMLEIAEDQKLETKTRHLAIGFVLTLVETESMLEIIKDRDPESFALKLAHYLADPISRQDNVTREGCAEQLCKLLTGSCNEEDDDEQTLFTWNNRLSVSTQSAIKSILLDSMKLEESEYIMDQLRYTVYKLATSDNNDDWPQLFPFLFQSLTLSTSSILLKSTVFRIFDGLALRKGKTMVHCAKTLHPLFLTTLDDYILDLDLRIKATAAAIFFILFVPVSSNEKNKFQELLPGMMRALTDTLSNLVKAEGVLNSFIFLAKEDPKFFRWQLRDVVFSMLEIAEDEKLETKTRHLAIEFVLTLVEAARRKAPGMMKKLPLFTHTCFAVLLKLLLDIEDKPSWHSANGDLNETTDNYQFGLACLHRLSNALGGKTITHVAMEQLGDYLVAPEWEKRHGALKTLVHIAEGSSKVMIKYLHQVVYMVLRSSRDPHHRVRYAAICAIAQFSVDFCPVFQEQYHKQVLSALAEAMDDSKTPRVQEVAALAIQNFFNFGKIELVPFLDKILNKLLVLLQNDNQMVKEATLKALSVIAFLSMEHFEKYYDIVVPYLKTIMVNANDKSDSLVRYALECITVVAMAVDKEKFRDDLKQVMEVLKMLLKSQVKELDTILYVLKASYRICQMGNDFLPYMSTIMPTLVECAQLEPDKTISSYEVHESIHKIKIGDAIIFVKGEDLLAAKSEACSLFAAFALALQEDFYPWISQAASILVPLVKFYIHDKVRENASDAMRHLLRSAKLAAEKGTAQGGNLSYFKQLSGDIVMAFGDAIYSEPNTKTCASILKELNNCLEIIESLLDEDHIDRIIDLVNHVMKESSHRKDEFSEREKSEDFDDEEAELMSGEREQEIKVFRDVGDILMTLIKTFKAGFLPSLDKLSLYLMPMRGEDKVAEERKTCILIFIDIVEHCDESAIKYYKIYLPFLLDWSNDENPDVRKDALYGLGLCAEYGGYFFKPYVGEVVSNINAVLTHSNDLEPNNVMAYDNAVSLLGSICQFHRESIDPAQIIPTWLSCLPIKSNLVKAKVVHDQLCSMVERSDRELFGPRYEHFPKILSVFAEVLCARTDLAMEETANRMKILLTNLTKTLPQNIWAAAWSLLLPQQAMEVELGMSLF